MGRSEARSIKASKHQSIKASKHQSIKASKHQSIKASKHQSIKASKSVQGSKYPSKSIEASSGQPNIRYIQATKHPSERVAELAAASKGAKHHGQQRMD
jgi:hypothetical protein